MLTTGAATAMFLIILFVSCVIGVFIGLVVSLAFRLHWNLKVAAFDVVLAPAVVVASGSLYASIARARGQLDSGVRWVLLTAAASVVLRHLVRFALARRVRP